jgi:4-amino-4-deoxy-L-arabinose transferase-like glycosyltransferase
MGVAMLAHLDWREAATLALLAAVVLLGLLLRLVGLGWGRPYDYHPDEWVILNPAMKMVQQGSWNPESFTYPSGLIYVERLIVSMLHLLDGSVSLATTGRYSEAFPEQFPFIYAGRVFVALAGALTAIPTYLAARSVSNRVGGIAAAIVVVVAPLGVLNSHYLTTDVPMAALAAVVLCLSLRGLEGARRWLVAAGFAAGLAASTKYDGGLVVVVPLVVLLTSCPPVHWLRRSTLATAVQIALASLAGFVLLTPAALFDTSDVWTGGILFQLQQYSGGFAGAQGSDNFAYYLQTLWGANGLGLGLSILVGLGLLLAVVQHRRADLAMLSFALAYFVLISVPPVRFNRNLLPLIPFCAVLAGRGVGWLADLIVALPRGRVHLMRRLPSAVIGLALIAVAATPSISVAIASDQEFREPDTRTIALTWIERNIPHGATIAREAWTPQVAGPDYVVTFVTPLALKPLEWYRSAGFDYVITSSTYFDRFGKDHPYASFYRSLLAGQIVMDLKPRAGLRGPHIVIVKMGDPDP